MRYIAFYLVIFLTNVIQGITGFAGTILAMPPGLLLVGYDVAKPILNVLGILAGVYVFSSQRRYVNWRELGKVVAVMTAGIFLGFFLKGLLTGYDSVLFKILGVFVILLAVQGFTKAARAASAGNGAAEGGSENRVRAFSLLLSAGVVHGMFVSGGPLLIGYLSRAVREKNSFRATISTIWILLNSIILVQDIAAGRWTQELVRTQLLSIPFLFAGMALGSRLVRRMSQTVFLKLTYLLLFISGMLLLFK